MLTPMHQLTPDDLRAVWSLLPYTAQALTGCIGAEAACALLNARPGCSFLVPKHANANAAGARRWAELAEIVGEPEMVKLATRWGGDVLDVPTCHDARTELRRRAIRAMFDRLTTVERLTGKQAIYEIGLKFAPISSRGIELICGRADAGEPAAQVELF